MAQIFLSYSTKSKAQVETLAEDLDTAGHQIWFDHKLTGGQAWWDQILVQIRECDLFVFALTPEALDSVACQREYSYAHQLGKNVLPILVTDGVPIAQLPPELSSIQFVDYRAQDRAAALKLMNALNHLPPARLLPDPLPEAPPVPISYVGSLREQINNPRPLSFDEQASLLFRLNEHLNDAEHKEDVLSLLRRLKARDDIFAKIDKQIDAMLLSSAPPAAAAASPPLSVPAVSAPSSPPLSASSEKTSNAVSKIEESAHRNPSLSTSSGERAAAMPEAQPKIEPARVDAAAFQSTKPISMWVVLVILSIFLVATVLLWTFAYELGSPGGLLSFAGQEFTQYGSAFEFVIVIVVPTVLLHGILSGLILRFLEPQPREALTLGQIIRSVLMGGPLNGFLVKRIVPSMKWWYALLIAISWCICIGQGFSRSSGFYFYASGIGMIFPGVTGGLLTALVLFLLIWSPRYSDSR